VEDGIAPLVAAIMCEAAARLAVLARQISEQKDLLMELRAEEEAIGEERLTLNDTWAELWAQSQLAPLSPDAMLEWLATRAEVLAEAERQVAAEHQAAALRRDELETKALLLAQLSALGFDSPRCSTTRPVQIAVAGKAKEVALMSGEDKIRYIDVTNDTFHPAQEPQNYEDRRRA
jgi:hypothetical protein